MAQKFKVEGLKDLEDALRDFGKTVGKNVLKRALTKAGRPIMDSAASRAPRLRGNLQMSITTGTKLSRRQKRMHKPQSTVEVFVGAGALVQAITQEFGTVDHPPQAFMRPAWDENKTAALSTIRDDIAGEIAKTAKRRAAKAARDLAKIRASK